MRRRRVSALALRVRLPPAAARMRALLRATLALGALRGTLGLRLHALDRAGGFRLRRKRLGRDALQPIPYRTFGQTRVHAGLPGLGATGAEARRAGEVEPARWKR